VPDYEDVPIESGVTKKLRLQWKNLEAYDDLVYRKFLSRRSAEPDYLQLLVPRSDVEVNGMPVLVQATLEYEKLKTKSIVATTDLR